MVDVRAWLETLGFVQYASLFADNGIDGRALPELSDQDLKEIGVAALGHRRVILAATKALGGGADALPRSSEPERRQITIMFCDLVGSTALSERLDPEDLRTLVRAYQQAAGTVIERYGGHIAQYLGFGLMTYFGWPRAHEDDAERAVRVALDVVSAMKQVAAKEPLQVRIGVATGRVVIGDTGDGDASVSKLAIGDTPNVAARLQEVADADEIVIAPTTRRLIGEAFELEDMGAHPLKGIVDPVRAWRVAGVAPTEGRFEAAQGARLTPMVGRDAEIAMILERWKRAKAGEGQVVLLSGEAGIGKSRVVRMVREFVALEPHVDLRYQGSPYRVNSVLHPVIEHFERMAGFDAADTADQKRDKLNAMLERSSVAATYLTPLFARMLSLEVDAENDQPYLSPQILKETTFEALIGQMLALAEHRPALMVFEDAHWIDPTTQDLLTRLIAELPTARIMLLAVFRPGHRPSWADQHHVLPMTLTRLGKTQASTMVGKVAGDRPLPQALFDQIISQTDGIPLYIEMLTKSVLESVQDAELAANDGTSQIAIPMTLQDSLMACLDRLGAAKDVAQICSCIGPESSLEVLQSVAAMDAAGMSDSIDGLVESGLLVKSEAGNGSLYGFRHALVQEVVYNGLVTGRRLALHAKIGAVLRDRFDETGDGKPEDVAHHLTQCGDFGGAVRFWHMAGEHASTHSAHNEAITQFRAALDALEKAEEDGGQASRSLELHLSLGPSLMSIKGWADPEVRAIYARASALAQTIGTPAEVFTATWGQWLVNQQFGQIDYAAELSRQVLALAEPLHESGYLLQAHHAAWTTRFRLAQFEDCLVHANQGIALYDMREHGGHAQTYGGHDPGVCARFHSGMSLWITGFPSQAVERIRDSVDLAANLAHPFSRAHAGFIAAQLYELRREPNLSLAHAEDISRIAADNDFAFIGAVGQALKARAQSARGQSAEAIPNIQDSIRQLRESQVGARISYFLSLLVAALLEGDDIENATVAADEAMAALSEHGEMTWVAEVYRLKGCVLHRVDSENDADAEVWLRRALELAGEQRAKSWELRAATDLARLWQGQGKSAGARALLGPVYDWFTEGFDTADLQDAKMLLEELAAA